MITVMRPQVGETVQDPPQARPVSIAADRAIRAQTDDLLELTEAQRAFQIVDAYVGMELVPNTRRLALMNCLLHGIEGRGEGAIRLGNTLGSAGSNLPKSDIILSNPPFGTATAAAAPHAMT